MKKNCKEILTIRNIINSLTDIMTRSANIDLDSEVIIANAGTLQEFDNIRIYPIKDVYYGQDKVGIYVEPKQVEVNEELEKRILQKELLDMEVETSEDIEEASEEVISSNNWWEKYK